MSQVNSQPHKHTNLFMHGCMQVVSNISKRAIGGNLSALSECKMYLAVCRLHYEVFLR